MHFDVHTSAFFFDVDGTLVDLQPHPDDVRADLDLTKLLSHLHLRCHGALAFVSGRRLSDLDRIFAPLHYTCVGLHGAEIRFPDGTKHHTSAQIMDHARPALRLYVAQHPGLFLEDKGATLAVHFRARPDLSADVIACLNQFAPGDDIAVQEGKAVAELKPTAYDKGSAILSLMKLPPFAGRTPVFFGDDLTDEFGFAAINALGGCSVRIGAAETPTDAQAHLENPQALRALLALHLT